MITAASVRGKCSLPSGSTFTQPEDAGVSGCPVRGENRVTACQLPIDSACVNRPASRSESSAPTSRSPRHSSPPAEPSAASGSASAETTATNSSPASVPR